MGITVGAVVSRIERNAAVKMINDQIYGWMNHRKKEELSIGWVGAKGSGMK
jgi:hypothetical protein